jgi:hypothetical protein
MLNTVNCENFPIIYPINGLKILTISRKELKRALITVGYPSYRKSLSHVGIWRARMLNCMVQGYFDKDLGTTDYYRNLEQSERAAASFLFGQGMTYWFAQNYLSMYYLVHVLENQNQFTRAPTVTPKAGAGVIKPKSRPDFIGRCPRGYHVFESKGGVRKPSGKTIANALAQVSCISRVRGTNPVTRTAACFAFKAGGLTGRVIDPEEEGECFDLDFDDGDAISKAYTFFLDEIFQEQSSQKIIDGFTMIEIDTGVYYGIDNEVLSILKNIPKKPARWRSKQESYDLEVSNFTSSINQVLESKREANIWLRDKNVIVGNDGIVLLDKTEE